MGGPDKRGTWLQSEHVPRATQLQDSNPGLRESRSPTLPSWELLAEEKALFPQPWAAIFTGGWLWSEGQASSTIHQNSLPPKLRERRVTQALAF